MNDVNIFKTIENLTSMGFNMGSVDQYGGYLNNDLTQNIMQSIEKSMFNSNGQVGFNSYQQYVPERILEAMNNMNSNPSMGMSNGLMGYMNNYNNMGSSNGYSYVHPNSIVNENMNYEIVSKKLSVLGRQFKWKFKQCWKQNF